MSVGSASSDDHMTLKILRRGLDSLYKSHAWNFVSNIILVNTKHSDKTYQKLRG